MRWILWGSALAGLLSCGESSAFGGSAKPPDIVVILSDDMGFSDLGCYGGEIPTPNLDAMAAGGLRFTRFSNTGRCCPTRASLLTGLYPHQAGVGHMMEDRGDAFPGYRGDLRADTRTIAEVLRPTGYRSYAAGKWHVTRFITDDGPKHNWPLARGFERFYGMVSGGGSFYDPFTLARDNHLISPLEDPEYRPETYYFTDAITDQAVRFLGDHVTTTPDRPFFLYVTYTAAHWPMHALPEDIAKQKGRYDAGYEPIRLARLQKAAGLGLVDISQGLSPTAERWEDVSNRSREIACMEVYAAMVARMDQGIGKIVGKLKEAGRLENTLIFFLQDNGGCAETMGRSVVEGRQDGPRDARPSLPPLPRSARSSATVPKQTRDGYPVRQGPNVEPGPADTYIGYGRGWANVSNTPFREYKHWVHEGGISTPLIAQWPAGIAGRGEVRHQPGHLIDIMATCVEVSGASYPKTLAGLKIPAMEGKSLTPAFANRPIDRDALYWEHEGNRAVAEGDWKLVAKGVTGPWELYHLAKDRVEGNDLSAQFPEKAAELAAKWETWAERALVKPWPWKR